MIMHQDLEEGDDDDMVNLMQEALAYVTAKCDQKRGGKGKTMRFDGIKIPPNTRPHPQPASKQVTVKDEIILSDVQASSSKGKGLDVAKITLLNVPVTNNSMERSALAVPDVSVACA
jgi:hypothetical protein